MDIVVPPCSISTRRRATEAVAGTPAPWMLTLIHRAPEHGPTPAGYGGVEDLTTGRRPAAQTRVQALIPVALSIVVAAIWMGLAINRPESTFHFAPAVAAAAWPVTARIRSGAASNRAAGLAALGGLVVALAATLILEGVDALEGPEVIGGSALGESIIASVVGAAWGGWVLTRGRPGFFLSLIGIPDEAEVDATEADKPASGDTTDTSSAP